MMVHPDRWLTAKRLRVHACLIGLALWSVYLWTVATPGLVDRNHNLKGTDFLHFYILGSLAREHRGAELYDMDAQSRLTAERVPQAAGIRYLPLYPPQVSLLFLPFAHFSYGWALGLWWALNCLIYAVCCHAIWRACPNLRSRSALVALIAVAFPAFFHLIAWGQTSAIALACFTVAFFLVREQRDFLAGLVLGCLVFKPQLGVAAAIVLLVSGEWSAVAGAVLSSAASLGAGVLYYGTGPLATWWGRMTQVRALFPDLEPRPYQTHGLRTFWTMILPWEKLALGAYLLSAGLTLAMTVALWKGKAGKDRALPFAALILATVLVAPHLTVYDLVILAPALLLLSDWILENTPSAKLEGIGTLLYLVYVLPLVGPLARWTHVQLSVPAMTALVYLVWRAAKDEGFEDRALAGEQER
jgi:alpha-1,2-mannosyltransferase